MGGWRGGLTTDGPDNVEQREEPGGLGGRAVVPVAQHEVEDADAAPDADEEEVHDADPQHHHPAPPPVGGRRPHPATRHLDASAPTAETEN